MTTNMEDNKDNKDSVSDQSDHDKPPLAGHDFMYYLKRFFWPLVVALAANMLLIALDQHMVYVIFIDILYFIILSWLIVKREKGSQSSAIIMGSLAGVSLGLFVSLFKLIYFWKVHYFFNIVTETLISGMVGLMVGAATFLLLNKKFHVKEVLLPTDRKNEKDNQETRGGDKDGR